MAGGVIGTLRVVLGGDNSGLDRSLKESQSSLAAFGNKVGLGLAAVAAAAAGATAALGMSVKAAIDSADNLNKMSQSTGLSTEELSKLKYAAELADVSSESLGKSMGKLSKALVSAGTDAAGQAGRAFAAMGVEVKNTADGSIRPSSDVIADIAEKFSGYRDGAEKTALAIALFGKAGASMIPLLNAGRDGFKEAGDEAQRFGLVLDKKTTMAAEAFNDNLKRMDKIKEGLVATMTAKMLPALEALSERLLKSREESALWSAVGDALAGVFNRLAAGALALMTTWERLFATVANLKTAFGQLATGDVSAAWQTMQTSAAETATAFGKLKESVVNLSSANPQETWSSQTLALKGLSREVAGYMDAWKAAAPSVGEAVNSTKNALDKFLETQAKASAGREAEAATIGKSAGEQERLKIAYQAQAIALAQNIPLTDALNARITAAGDAAALAAMKIEAASVAQQVMNPAEKFAQDMANLQAVYAATSMTAETFAARQQQLAESVGATWNQAGAGMASGFAALATQFGKSSKEMATAAKVFGIIEATINTYTAFTKALASGPPPFNYVAAAGVLAAGMAKVIAIKSQSIPSYATGGLVGGIGNGTSDSNVAMLSRGEFVMPAAMTRQYMPELSAMRSGNYAPESSRGSSPTVVNLSMGVAATREGLRHMIDGINEMVADGYRINVVAAA